MSGMLTCEIPAMQVIGAATPPTLWAKVAGHRTRCVSDPPPGAAELDTPVVTPSTDMRVF